MSEAFANEHGFEISRGVGDNKLFTLDSEKIVRSIGRVRVGVELPGMTLERPDRWFYVFAKCTVPLILGMKFLADAETFTKNRHMLEEYSYEFPSTSNLLLSGSCRKKSRSPSNRIECALDGRMSSQCTRKGNSPSRYAQICVELGDGSELEKFG